MQRMLKEDSRKFRELTKGGRACHRSPCKISIAKLNIIFNPGYPGRKKENMKIYKNYGCLAAEKE